MGVVISRLEWCGIACPLIIAVFPVDFNCGLPRGRRTRDGQRKRKSPAAFPLSCVLSALGVVPGFPGAGICHQGDGKVYRLLHLLPQQLFHLFLLAFRALYNQLVVYL